MTVIPWPEGGVVCDASSVMGRLQVNSVMRVSKMIYLICTFADTGFQDNEI